jgi:hypothetical protein
MEAETPFEQDCTYFACDLYDSLLLNPRSPSAVTLTAGPLVPPVVEFDWPLPFDYDPPPPLEWPSPWD